MQVAAEVQELLRSLDRSPAQCASVSDPAGQDELFIDWSPLAKKLQSARDSSRWWHLLQAAAEEDRGCDAAIGCMVGMAICDAVGHPLEFVPVDPGLPDDHHGGYVNQDRAYLRPLPENGKLRYANAFNKFQLLPGQWTDDTSMGLCLADSLLVHPGYHGGDARVRWHMWWFHSYCNAFRHDDKRRNRFSIGLGGNIAKSLREVQQIASGSAQPAETVPATYRSGANDAGNGSIMRLAPVPIAWHYWPKKAMEVAELQSLATHPGEEAAACSQFLAFLIVEIIRAHKEMRRPSASLQRFLSESIDTFLDVMMPPPGSKQSEAWRRLRALLTCNPPGPEEANWDWKQPVLKIKEAVQARSRGPGGKYNGHPVSREYFGSYCLDCIAMSLWALWRSTNFGSCMLRVVNLLGDADSTGAVAGQLAGAVYGFSGIAADNLGSVGIANLKRWDPCAEVGLRATLLYKRQALEDSSPGAATAGPAPPTGSNPVMVPSAAPPTASSRNGARSGGAPKVVRLRQLHGYPDVRAFQTPTPGAPVIATFPSGADVHALQWQGEFLLVQGMPGSGKEQTSGWIGIKHAENSPQLQALIALHR